jgi:hypothetical protein
MSRERSGAWSWLKREVNRSLAVNSLKRNAYLVRARISAIQGELQTWCFSAIS